MVAHVNINHIYKFPLETVVKTHLNKYPTVKEANVIEMKEMEMRMESDGVAYKRRIATMVNVVPRLLRKLLFLDVPTILMEEECWIDGEGRRCWLKSRNLTFAEHASVCETSIFTPDPGNSQWTKFEQEGVISVSGLGRAGGLLEVFIKRFVDTGVWKSIRIMEELMQESSPLD